MSLDLAIRCIVSFVIGFTMTYATCWLLSLFLWGWLACILAVLISMVAANTEVVCQATTRAGDLAVEGAAATLNAYRSLRARFAK